MPLDEDNLAVADSESPIGSTEGVYGGSEVGSEALMEPAGEYVRDSHFSRLVFTVLPAVKFNCYFILWYFYGFHHSTAFILYCWDAEVSA